jgi:hypothetical protein
VSVYPKWTQRTGLQLEVQVLLPSVQIQKESSISNYPLSISNGLRYYWLRTTPRPVVALHATALHDDLGATGVAPDPQYKSIDGRSDRDSDRRWQRGMGNTRQARLCGDILHQVGRMVGLPDGLDLWRHSWAFQISLMVCLFGLS